MIANKKKNTAFNKSGNIPFINKSSFRIRIVDIWYI